ncbi:hypothetical protein DYB26_010913 [Aphanomyces astaci]|uniref:Chitin-binding type-4 domain-containing protein n=1 Tax=Aphanomyces astaci TaxID=112090 RepID=A0A397DFH7_APHAT|nr:hypothetical protein DYB36_012243 [Aphanomyces astaci]RHY42725.1 hypothetical protein DYB34_012239 [Aphanomyces astaci]RHY64378.1 hypothetical protein DYB38_011394 [Aphanomyces astaci]RHZ42996.1 hypothetical protein DYB26_010913 [Aphanomyces astaci]
MKFASAVATLSSLALWSHSVEGHGRLVSPPHRGYIGKLPAFQGLVPVNYDDDGLSAGGIGGTQGGKHGVCGDPYTGVREHETGGKYGLFPVHGNRVIGKCYAPGAAIDLTVEITANHWGHFEFQLCKLGTKDAKETEECFQNLVQANGQKDWEVPRVGKATFNMQYKLPAAVTCEGDAHCVLRWWYISGNNPGGLNAQEQFWNCADIYISNTCGAPAPPTALPITSTAAPVTTAKPTITSTTAPQPTTAAPKPPTAAPATTPAAPVTTPAGPITAGPTPAPPVGACGSCTNCYYAPTNACFSGWTKEVCASVSSFQWCGP